ncbi:outer membrane protein [Novosphingobium beihaiensis]|uniref:Outer membrane beta-barrel protein n=1 Tax=Novosphingobium beihaiensis TaxID=2930389 RepID=A0ABT0BJY8_9SPHN|nr:outer membrane beta-barrel protein [Novosphingobium beihaiensis]MCJ2185368.1 outer membrane beta-barrel protein [Novosphingobium beihaiensis]
MKLALSILPIASVALAVPVQAEDAGFSGPRAGVIAGYDRTDLAPGAGPQGGGLYGLQLGYDWNLGGVVLGVEADLAGSTADTDLPALRSDAQRYATVAARAGFEPLYGVLLFARGGVAHARVDIDPGADFDGSGFTVGGGAELALSGRLYLRSEYRYSDYGDRLRGQQVLGGVGLRF